MSLVAIGTGACIQPSVGSACESLHGQLESEEGPGPLGGCSGGDGALVLPKHLAGDREAQADAARAIEAVKWSKDAFPLSDGDARPEVRHRQ